MIKHAVYNSEDGKWYRQGDDPWTVRVVSKNEVLRPLVYVIADTHMDAFEKLFDHPILISPVTRAPHRESAFGGD